MTPAIEKFQNGEKVGTAFKTMLNRLVDDSGPVKQALSALGVAQRDANGELKTGKQILFETGEAFQDLNKNQQAFVAQQLAGKEHAAKFLASMNEWDQVSEVYETAMDSAGSITEELQAKLESADKQLDRWNTAWQNLSVTIGDQFKVAATEAVEGSTNIVNAIQSAVDEGALDPFFDMLNELANDLSVKLKGIAEAMPEALEKVDWGDLAESIKDVADSFAGWFDGLDLSKPDDLAEAVQRVSDGIATLNKFLSTFVTVAGGFGKTVVKIIEQLNSITEEIKSWDNSTDVAIGSLELLVEKIRDTFEVLNKMPPALKAAIPGVPMTNLSPYIDALDSLAGKLDEAQHSAQETNEELQNVPEEKTFSLDITKPQNFKEFQKEFDDIPEKKKVGVQIDDGDTTQDIVDKLNKMQGKEVPVDVDDQGTAQDTKEEIDKQIPKTKKMEIEADLKMAEMEKEIAEIEAKGKVMQSAFEATAKVNMKQAEASMEKFKSSVESVNTGIESTGDVLGDLFGLMTKASDDPNIWVSDIEDLIDREYELREQEFEQQKKLIQQQIELMRAKEDAIRSGDGLIKIEADGLEPDLEKLLWTILERIQVRVNEASSEFLLGINS